MDVLEDVMFVDLCEILVMCVCVDVFIVCVYVKGKVC